MNQLSVTDVRIVPGDSGFLLDDGITTILYDSGFAFTGERMAEKIKGVLGNRKLDYVFLTHSHYDHALGSAYLSAYWDEVQIIAGEHAATVFKKPTAKRVMRDLDQKAARDCGVLTYNDRIDDLQVHRAVTDGDWIDANSMSFTAIHLPGHTRCSFGFYCPKRRLLLGCETLGVFNGIDEVVPSYLVGIQQSLDAIDRVLEMEVEQILVPHYGILEQKETAIYLKRSKESAKQTADAIWRQLRNGKSRDEIISWFKERFYHGYIQTIYPIAAMELNTGIMIDLVQKEYGGR